jgi:hypothetical protein
MPLGSCFPAPGIRFNDYIFSEPARLDGWVPPRCAGLFGILVADPNWAPKPFQSIYFGEFGNNAPTSAWLTDYQKIETVWRGKTLLVSVLPMPFSTTSQRCALQNELIWAYHPLCQEVGSKTPPVDLARKLEEIEKRHQEQTAQMMLLLANVNRAFEPQSEPAPRRSIGFRPQSEPAR